MATGSLVSLNSSAKVYEKKETRKSEPHKGTDWDYFRDKMLYFSRLSGDRLGQFGTLTGDCGLS